MEAMLRDTCFRLISSAVRKYSSRPDERNASSRLLLTNALRLYIDHASAEDAAKVVLEVLSRPVKGEAA